jgi:hypothetical protein
MHPVYTKEYVEGVRATHKPPVKVRAVPLCWALVLGTAYSL